MPNVVAVDPRTVALSPTPIRADWILAGDPQASSAEVARSADGTCVTCDWATTPGTFRWYFGCDEIIHVVEGELFVSDEPGAPERRIGPGDAAVFPAGTWQVWRVTKPLRKVAICRRALPPVAGLALRALSRLAAIARGERAPAPAADIARAA